LQFEATDSMVRFVDSECRGAETRAELESKFPGARSIEMEQMPLRAIFPAIAKEKRGKPTSNTREVGQPEMGAGYETGAAYFR
jgi:hypothetical protein